VEQQFSEPEVKDVRPEGGYAGKPETGIEEVELLETAFRPSVRNPSEKGKEKGDQAIVANA